MMHFGEFLCFMTLLYGTNSVADEDKYYATTDVHMNTAVIKMVHSASEKTPVESTEDEQKDTFVLVRSTGEFEFRTFMDSDSVLTLNYTIICKRTASNYTITIHPKHSKVLKVPKNEIHVYCAGASVTIDTMNMTSYIEPYVMQGSFDVHFSTGVIGSDVIEITFTEGEGERNLTSTAHVQPYVYDVVVIRKLRPVDTLFRIVVYCVQVLVLTGFGAELDIQIVKETLRKPIAPAIGFCCQYMMMPLIAFGVAKLATQESTVALGIFVSGCCPGGGNSNMYTYLLNGDLSLSITMTTISTVAALAMLPAWIYSLGSLFIEDKSVTIPFSSVAISLAVLLVPLTIGVFLRSKFPKVAAKLQKALKPVIIFCAIVLIIVGVYSNLFIFRLFKPQTVLAACLLPYIGYLIGGIISAVFRQPWKRIKTIIIETGMQNASIAYILLTTSFMPPFGDLAAVAPVASAVMTPLPPFLVTVFYLTYQRCHKKYNPVKQNGDDAQHQDEEEPMKPTSDSTSKTDSGIMLNEKLTST